MTRPKPLEDMQEIELNGYLISLGGSTDQCYLSSGSYLRSEVVERILALEKANAAQRAIAASEKSVTDAASTVSVFYAWQSDTRADANRTLIQNALEGAAEDLRDDTSLAIEPVVDRDTEGLSGAPDIANAILDKIDASAAMVADVTIVTSGDGRAAPNPNVLIELGYGLKALGAERIILVQNEAFGGPELLPFDLRGKRVEKYNSPENAESRVEARSGLQRTLRAALELTLRETHREPASEFPVELTMEVRDKKIQSERHDYQLAVFLKNTGTNRIDDWHVDLEIPTRLLSEVTQTLRVPERSDEKVTVMRGTAASHRGPIFPSDRRLAMTVEYRVDEAVFGEGPNLFQRHVVATAYVHGTVAAREERLVQDLQKF